MQVPVSPEINQVLDEAAALSVRRNQYFVGVEHLWEVLLAKPDLLPQTLLVKYAEILNATMREVSTDAWRGSVPIAGQEVFYTPRTAAVTSEAARLAHRLSKSGPTATHLLMAVLADAYSAPSRTMDRLGYPRGELLRDLSGALSKPKQDTHAPKAAVGATAKAQATASAKAEAEAPREEPASSGPTSLESLTRDLTELARKGKLDKAIGRNDETLEILEILARKNKNNVILLGEAGVGKTHVVEGLAITLARQKGDSFLAGFRILELNLAALMAGTQYRGAFEEKILALLAELKQAKNTILFIDEIHLIMGAGATEGGSMDMANLLKPALSRGEIRCIGATTLEEYRKFIEKDPAIERRFQPVRLEELSPRATLEVLTKLAPSLERHHGVRVSGKALKAAVVLTRRYMPNRRFPDKAIDALDQACARYRLRIIARNARREEQHAEGREESADGAEVILEKVTPHDVRKVISRAVSVPIEEITADERRRLDSLEQQLKQEIIGQDEAVRRAVAATKRARAGLADPKRPDASMLFLGPTGVGKTQLAKCIADHVLGSPDHLITFDMSEYIEEHSVSRLLGAPPGYVGSDQEGRLTGAVRNAPFSILLFDEIEKAHPRIFDIFLPVLDEGRLKDSYGREVSFRNCIIIFTSNIGAECLSRTGTESAAERVVDELRDQFRPEFINRIDEIVPFYPLLFEDVRAILKLCFENLAKRLKERDVGLRVYQGAYEYLAEKGYSQEFGARELQRTVDRLIVNPVSAMMLEKPFTPGECVEVLVDKEKLGFRRGKKHEKEARDSL